ncbi:MAG: FtsX-like permease family protein [Cyanobacteria bacterium SIG26]|nr:FtsX-like permease family protein [Cyanobacteria bacterium SIG26]
MNRNFKSNVKKHIPKDWLCELRILYRLGKETLNDIIRTGWVNLVIITTMAAILMIFGACFRSALSISAFSKEIGSALEISVYLKNDTNPSEVKHEIQKIKHVQDITIIPKSDSWNKLKTEMNLPNIENPLPDTLHVKVDSPDNLQIVFDDIKKTPAVEDMSYAKDLATKMELVNHVVKTITLVVIAVMGLLTITIINNTIQLVIQSRKEEIEIMRLMGVSNWYIRFPFIMQGAFYGLSGSILALIPLNYIQNGLVNIHKFFMVPMPVHAQGLVILIMFAMSITFGAVGSHLCIKKHLQV